MSLMTAEQLIDISLDIVDGWEDWVSSATAFRNYLYLAIVGSDLAGTSQGKILRYKPNSQSWEELYSVKLSSGEEKAAITLFPETEPSELFVSLSDSSSSQLLHSIDGEMFSLISEENKSIQQLLSFQNKLYALPSEVTTVPLFYTETPWIKWQGISIPNFGDTDNQAVAKIVAFNGCLYAGTFNLERGFEIWKQENDSPWKPIITEGGREYALNPIVSSLIIFKGALYAAVGTPTNKQNYITAPEILRIYPDDSWDLIVGKPKVTPSGLKVPLSIIGKGFDELSDCTLQFIIVHQDCLYAGTQSDRGLQFWMSEDGESWEPIIVDKLSDRSKIDIITVVSTPFGLVAVVQEDGEVSILLASS